jgi:hypothetical protein
VSNTIELDYAKPARPARRLSRLAVASVILSLICNPYFAWIVTRRVGFFYAIHPEEFRILTRLLFPSALCLVLSIAAIARILRSQDRLRGEYVAAIGGSICITWILSIALLWFWNSPAP